MDVIMPQLGETVVEGTVSTWYKRPGDAITADEPLFEVETEKVTTEIPAPASGVLTEIFVATGIAVKVGTRLAVIDVPTTAAVAASPVAQHAAAPAPAHAEPPAGVAARRSGEARLSPLVRRLLKEQGLEVGDVAGTGRDRRITPADVLARAHRMPGVAGTADDPVTVPLNRVRRLTAENVARSKLTIPHALQAVEVDFEAVQALRHRIEPAFRTAEGFALTYLPFVAHAACAAIARFPYINASYGASGLTIHRHVHLGIAIDLKFEGLAVAVLRDAQQMTVRTLAREIHRLSEAARRGTLAPDEATGSTYTISNNGSFGTYFSAPIINPPQVAVLSLDAVRKRPVVVEGAGGNTIAIRPVGVLAQSFDHRAMDGAYSAAFLSAVRQHIESTDWTQQIE